MPDLMLMSYNVCWECMSGEKTRGSAVRYGRNCAKTMVVSGINKCYENVVDICSHVPYDFIGIQEGSRKLGSDISSVLSDKYGIGYDIIGRKVGVTYPLIVFKSGRFNRVGDSVVFDMERGRPVIGQLFQHKSGSRVVAVISIHAPHSPYGLRMTIGRCLNKLEKTRSVDRVIVFGDFNKEHLNNFTVGNLKFSPSISKVRYFPTGWNTSGDIGKSAYYKAIDNIIVSGGTMIHGPETWNIDNNRRFLLPKSRQVSLSAMTSDHSPVSAVYRFR